MKIAVTVLGSSGVFPTRARSCSGYLLELNGSRIWLEAGPGSWRNLIEYVDYHDLDGVILSHRHPDHTSDVFMAYHARFWGEESGPLAPIPLWAPAETLEGLEAFYPGCNEAFTLHTIDEHSAVEIEDARLTFYKMAHPPETLGLRIESEGAVVSYSADSGPDADFEKMAGDADLFICEATLQDSDELWHGHLRASQASEIAGRVGARRLVLTHLPPGRDLDRSLAEARAAAVAECDLAYDGMRVELEG
jgi:ribonuclease BN (tRNA processing enzyme)